MLSWIDNTGLHGAGRCLTGTAETPYDLRGLMQLAVLLVFSDLLAWGDYESHQVEEESRRYCDQLRRIGVKSEVANNRFVLRHAYQSACDGAAEAAVEGLRYEFRPGARAAAGIAFLDLPRGAEHRSGELIRLIRSDDPDEIAREKQHALDGKAAGAVRYMLAANANLRMLARERLAAGQPWTPGDSFDFEGYLRTLLNRELAAQTSGYYVPAPSRAALIDVADKHVTRLLDAHFGRVAAELRRRELPFAYDTKSLPRVAEALISLARGSVEGLIQEALRFRERARPLREFLQQIETAPDSETKKRRDLPLLADDLRRDLGLTKGGSALTLTISAGSSDPAANAAFDPFEFFDWVRRRWTRKRRIVLTELAREYAWNGDDRIALHRLAEAAAGRRLDVDHPILRGLA